MYGASDLSREEPKPSIAPGIENNENEPAGDDSSNINQWVYSSSFEDLKQGVVLDPSGLGSGSNTPKSSVSGTSTPSADVPGAASASLMAALEAEYSLKPESRTLVRQRRYKRNVVRTGSPAGNRKAEAAAMIQAKGAALVSTTTKVLSTTNRFITDLGETQKKDLTKLIQATKSAATKTGSSGTSPTPPVNGEEGNNVDGQGAECLPATVLAENFVGNPATAAAAAAAATPGQSDANTPSIGDMGGSPYAGSSPAPRPAVVPRASSFTGRMFNALKGSSNSSPVPAAATAGGSGPQPTPALGTPIAIVTESVDVIGLKGGESGYNSSQAITPTRESLSRRNTADSTLSAGGGVKGFGKEEDLGYARQNTNGSTVSGGGADDAGEAERYAMTDNNFDMEVDMEGAEFNESASEMGDQYSETASQAGGAYYSDSPQPAVGGVARPDAGKRRSSYFGSLFGGTTSAADSPSQPSTPIDPIFKVVSPALAAIGRQLRNVEQQSVKAQEAELKSWRASVKPILEAEIAALEKQVAGLMLQIERDAHMGNAHINALEGVMKDLNDELDIKKRKVYLPDSAITLGSQGVYFGMNDFWLQQLSGHFVVKLIPKKDAPSDIHVTLLGTQEGSGETQDNL
jgi:hypothetical protein